MKTKNKKEKAKSLNADSTQNHIFELIRSAQNGNEDVFSELKKRYEPLIENAVLKNTVFGMTSQDIEDLRQEALVQFYNAVLNFDCSVSGIEFGLYAKICLENRLISYVRSYSRKRAKDVFLNDEKFDHEESYSDPMQDMIEQERLAALVLLIQQNLSEYESRVWWLYVSGLSVSDIAKRLDIDDPRSVTNAIYRIRKKLRMKIGEEK